ncbi:MAG: DEAD/DEAH box helicase [Verrucomicrobia bacterium]|nr:DEAD/DEAH box helicase [Verrucomicrobiota bacterium]
MHGETRLGEESCESTKHGLNLSQRSGKSAPSVSAPQMRSTATRKMEVIAITDKVERKTTPKSTTPGKKKTTGAGQFTIGNAEETERPKQVELQFNVGELEKALYARVVKKCGNRNYWDEWAKDIADIAQTHIARITTIVSNPENVKEAGAFQSFANELRDDLNDSITNEEVIEMLAQHLITKPVFDALFKDYSFASNNPVSLAMQKVLDVLQEHHLEKEADTLEKFYASVRMRADGIENAAGKQKIVVELYDKFFRNAFPRMTERLGIVYTPVEVVDFIIRSINDLLKQEFNVTLGTKGVHIIDPFTGTGTFVTRLLQSGLIPLDQLPHKYKHEIHANEIVLLAYYIAAINIEAVYHSLAGKEYTPFEGICLTDTFQMYEKDDLVSDLMENNSERRRRQTKLDIRVIMGNPPYSKGQDDANDNNQNVSYPNLDKRIRDTYGAKSEATNVNGLYNSYIRSIRWASDRIGKSGIIGFVTNGGFLEGNAAAGLRKCLADEFSSIFIFHLRGNQRTSGELSRKEGGKIFGSGSRAPIAISLLVKRPGASTNGQISFHDIGDYLTTEQKLRIIAEFGSINGITKIAGWKTITPDQHGDWLKQRDSSFSEYLVMGDKSGMQSSKIFDNYSNGLKTQRDDWCYNSSKTVLSANMQRMISLYNNEVKRFHAAYGKLEKKDREDVVDKFVITDPAQISWTRALKNDLVKGKYFAFDPNGLTKSLYRPFHKQWLYFDRHFNEMVYKMPRIFPDAAAQNIVIGFSSSDTRSKLSVFISDCVPSLHAVDMVGSQFFPLYLYETEVEEPDTDELFTKEDTGKVVQARRDAITDASLTYFRGKFEGDAKGRVITKEDIFYYVYGILQCPDYRSRFADNLSKELPRIPCVKTAEGFWGFSRTGRDLAALHLNYEKAEPHAVTLDFGKNRLSAVSDADYYVTKMKFASKADKSVVVYNPHITIRNIPIEAYEYVVNGKPALEWVMEWQGVTTDKDSGIVNDANLWATETMGSARYPLDLFCRVITVSLETQKLVKSLPPLDI